MAKRKGGFFRRARRRAGGAFRSAKRYGRSSSENTLEMAMYAGVYGAVRQDAANLIKPLTDKVSLGGYSDEIALGAIGYAAAKWGPGPVRKFGKSMLMVEAALTGSNLRNNLQPSSGSSGQRQLF